MMNEIIKVLMERDGMSKGDAIDLFNDAKEEFYERLENGEDCFDFCEEWFGLEPDYIMDLI